MVHNKKLTTLEPEEMELLASPPTQAPGNRMQGGALSVQTLEKKIQLTQLCEKKPSSNILRSPQEIQNSTRCRRRMEINYSSVSRIFGFSILSENPSIVSYSRRHHHWTSSGSSRCKTSCRIWHRSCNSINCKPRIHNLG